MTPGGDAGYRRFVPAEAGLLAQFLTAEDWPYHRSGGWDAAQVRREVAAGQFDNEQTRAFWIVAGGGEAGLIRLLDLADDSRMRLVKLSGPVAVIDAGPAGGG